MVDSLSKAERSVRMSLIRGRGTGPEKVVRRIARILGHRFRGNVDTLPGTPDLVFSALQSVVFVHGCYWHRHVNCRLGRLPKSRLDFWLPKLEANRRRDARSRRALNVLGWRTMVIWECQLRNEKTLVKRMRRFLSKGRSKR